MLPDVFGSIKHKWCFGTLLWGFPNEKTAWKPLNSWLTRWQDCWRATTSKGVGSPNLCLRWWQRRCHTIPKTIHKKPPGSWWWRLQWQPQVQWNRTECVGLDVAPDENKWTSKNDAALLICKPYDHILSYVLCMYTIKLQPYVSRNLYT